MLKRLSVYLVLSVLVIGVAAAQVGIRAAAKNTWMVSGSGCMSYVLSSGSPEDGEGEGLSVSLVPRVLWFPVAGLGVGGDVQLDHYANSYTNTTFGIGPRAAYYLRRSNRRYPSSCCLTPCVGPDGWWMPYAGATFMYLTSSSTHGSMESSSNGWRLKLGIGVSPVIGTKGTMPVELGFQTDSQTYGEHTSNSNKLYLEVGFGAFLWKKNGE